MRVLRITTIALLAAAAAAPMARADAPRLETMGHERVLDALRRVWKPATGAVGGEVVTTRRTIRGTASQRVYRAARDGIRSYTRRVPGNGTYAVDLYVAELARRAPGHRVFDVLAQGQPVATGVDVAASVGRYRADHVLFTTVVTDRVLRLAFRARVGKPVVSGIEITRMTPSTAPATVRWGNEFTGRPNWWFDDPSWEADVGVGHPPGWGNNELQSYSYRPKNITLTSDGMLAIKAYPESYADVDGQRRDYSSARIETGGRFAFTYGLVEARIKLPGGHGIWPAFWAVGDDVDRVGWPASGEFDIVEVFKGDPYVLHGSLNGPRKNGRPYTVTRAYRPGFSLADDFHVYSALRVPGAIQMRLDGRPYVTYTAADLGPTRRWTFDKPYRLLLNVAVGGDQGGTPDATTQWPATMLVDWVRVSY